jgi:regulator of replication initiation timing|tara:strand:- start:225 stop:485 length:261 start_codon:yes stop_codon:yes gene_type:complete
MSIYKNKAEEPTAKESKIQELHAEVKLLRQKYLKTLEENSELLRENKSLSSKVTDLEIEIKTYDTREEVKKKINLNKTYDGLQDYK